jgi:ubiquinone/menaquinone biosynthesis C-methylase UbiE
MTEPAVDPDSESSATHAPYALATGSAAVRRLRALHGIYSPFAQGVLVDAGLKAGMNVADFGCGVGMTTRMLAEMVGPTGHVTGVDFSAAQVQEARKIAARERLGNVTFVQADACKTGLPRASFDLVYCRFLLLHLPDPAACIQEMLAVLRPGGILVIEDGDLTTAMSQPPTAVNAFADLFGRLGPTRGLDYSMAKNLPQWVEAAGISNARFVNHQPPCIPYEHRLFPKWSVEEAGPAFVGAGLITEEQLANTILEMQKAADSPDVTILAPRMYFASCVNGSA